MTSVILLSFKINLWNSTNVKNVEDSWTLYSTCSNSVFDEENLFEE